VINQRVCPTCGHAKSGNGQHVKHPYGGASGFQVLSGPPLNPKVQSPDGGGNSVATRPIFDNWITKQQLAEHLGMSTGFINKYMKLGLPCRHFGRAVRYRLGDVVMWIERNTSP
jgi:hypothetical protein